MSYQMKDPQGPPTGPQKAFIYNLLEQLGIASTGYKMPVTKAAASKLINELKEDLNHKQVNRFYKS